MTANRISGFVQLNFSISFNLNSNCHNFDLNKQLFVAEQAVEKDNRKYFRSNFDDVMDYVMDYVMN